MRTLEFLINETEKEKIKRWTVGNSMKWVWIIKKIVRYRTPECVYVCPWRCILPFEKYSEFVQRHLIKQKAWMRLYFHTLFWNNPCAARVHFNQGYGQKCRISKADSKPETNVSAHINCCPLLGWAHKFVHLFWSTFQYLSIVHSRPYMQYIYIYHSDRGHTHSKTQQRIGSVTKNNLTKYFFFGFILEFVLMFGSVWFHFSLSVFVCSFYF